MGAGASAAEAPSPAEASTEAPEEAERPAITGSGSFLDDLRSKSGQRQLVTDFCQIESASSLPSADWFENNSRAMMSKIDDVMAVFPGGLEKPVSTSWGVGTKPILRRRTEEGDNYLSVL